MKALIVEINRKYCIIVTPDGRFLRRAVPAGIYEIGDEILIDENNAGIKKTKVKFYFGIPARIAAGFAVAAILVTGAYFGVKYIGNTGSITTMVASAPAEARDAEEALQQGNQQDVAKTTGQDFDDSQSAGSAALNEGEKIQQSPESGSDTGSEGNTQTANIAAYPLLFEGLYSLDSAENGTDTFIPAGFNEIDISYRIEKYTVEDNGNLNGPGILWLQIKNTFDNMLYNGNITVSFIDAGDNAMDTRSIDFISFGPGNNRTEKIYFGSGYVAFSLMVYGEIK